MDIERMKKKIDLAMANYRQGAELVFIHANDCLEMLEQGDCSCDPHVALINRGGEK